jgi:transposase
MPTKVSTIEIDMTELEDALRRAEERLDEKDYAILRAGWTPGHHYRATDGKNITIARLRKLLFGSPTEKTNAVVGNGKDSQSPPPRAMAASAPEMEPVSSTDAEKSPPKGHGRNGADAYAGAQKVVVRHETLQPGDPCPKCEEGTVYETGRPGVLVRLVGQAPVAATVYELQKLRCNLCSEIFTAQAPAGIGTEKYDATSGSMVALLKYGSGMPFNRMEGLQANLGIPLPASTQWDIVEAKAERIEPAFEELIRQAADGEVVHNDDTTVKILEMMGNGHGSLCGRRRRKTPKRRKCRTVAPFTSHVSTRRQKIALFLSATARRRELAGRVVAPGGDVGRADPNVRCPLAESAGGFGNDRGPLLGAWPASVRGRGRAVSRGVSLRAGILGGHLPQRRDRPWAKPVAVGASALSPVGERSDDGETSHLAWPAVGGPVGRAELVAGRGDFVHAEALGSPDAILARARRAA